MDWSLFLIFLGACAAAGTTGAAFPPGPWYDKLDKPAWTPPNWLFPLAWTALYIAMAVAAARVAPLEGSAHAMAFWALQIALNALWTPVFFGLRKLKAGMAVLACLWVAVVATCLAMMSLDPVAGWLFVPYVIWVSYAGALNAAIVLRNPGPQPRAA